MCFYFVVAVRFVRMTLLSFRGAKHRRISFNKRSFAFAQDDEKNNVWLCKDDTRRHCEELATKQSRDRGQAPPSAMTCGWQNVQEPVIAHSVARSFFLDCFAYARNDEKYLPSNPLPKIRLRNDGKKRCIKYIKKSLKHLFQGFLFCLLTILVVAVLCVIFFIFHS